MKKMVSFRLDLQTIQLLSSLSEKYDFSKTKVVETAVKKLAKRKKKKSHPLSEFAGSISPKEADDLLSIIYSSRVNKDIKEITDII